MRGRGLSRGGSRGERAGAGIFERAKMPLRSRESGVSMIGKDAHRVSKR